MFDSWVASSDEWRERLEIIKLLVIIINSKTV